MGQGQSAEEVLDAVNQVDNAQKTTPQKEGNAGTKLFKYVTTINGEGNWELASSNAKPHFYDSKEDSNSSGKKDFFLEIEQGDVDVHVDAGLNYVLDVDQRRVTFAANNTIYALKFQNDDACRTFGEQLNDAIFYNQYGLENDEDSRAKVMEDYAGTLFSKETERLFEPMDTNADDEDKEAANFLTPEKLREKQAKETAKDEDAINAIVMGAGENNYLLRGCKFDVLRNLEGGGVEDKGLSTRKTRGTAAAVEVETTGAAFTPSRVLLTHGERRMNLLTPENRSILHHADIEVGKIVTTYNFQKDSVDVPIMDIASDYKAAQMEDHSQFLGLDQNRICRWDLREKRGVVQSTPVLDYVAGKDYSRGTNFTCMATSGDGFVAVGSRDGRIRLYNSRVLTQAKTSIPGLGAPITAIDVTYDGKWVLATADRYLMLVKTTYVNDKGKDANAFESRMGGRGAVPRLLRLKPEDAIKTQVNGAKFTKGKFTWITEGGQSERWIVAGCGRFSVVWNFSKIRTTSTQSLGYGGLPTCMDYYLRAKEEEVVDVQFVHQKYMRDVDQAAMVVATPHSLFNLA
ncbi:hypothetical protein VOLCADRAFT_82851 [Volvox carteri f. nagariensis]|uniref:Uncharacterized protein n=1 Tax=Volvox carteri f. nagariensis TaxID=3068 RepID=D8U7C3_VOLCA|nr:uncharacterized protein VOLCADRAFT_82851 [Volvox carteri f. nagariensis]EFJ44461.1 hypothetical protein VOLCADRAFT_82851 [Volvox carteri f. nagariensis]|eukprot:XP_002954568.1 hypothetical protein VOLCADRAFT_82851 [Volvox carteri f. nagariensis]